MAPLNEAFRFPTLPAPGYRPPMRPPDRTELEFGVIAACLAIPGGYWLIRTLLALI
jgi:hypothetical protein